MRMVKRLPGTAAVFVLCLRGINGSSSAVLRAFFSVCHLRVKTSQGEDEGCRGRILLLVQLRLLSQLR